MKRAKKPKKIKDGVVLNWNAHRSRTKLTGGLWTRGIKKKVKGSILIAWQKATEED